MSYLCASITTKLIFCVLFPSGFAVGIYTTNSPEACFYVANDCEANVIVVENKQQLSKILQVLLTGQCVL